METPFLRLMIYSNQMQENIIKRNHLQYKFKTNDAIVIKRKMKKDQNSLGTLSRRLKKRN